MNLIDFKEFCDRGCLFIHILKPKSKMAYYKNIVVSFNPNRIMFDNDISGSSPLYIGGVKRIEKISDSTKQKENKHRFEIVSVNDEKYIIIVCLDGKKNSKKSD